MNELINCDLAIIGAGSGGLSLAAGAAQLGLKVVLVEKGLMGGDCLNYGCVPSKSLLAAALSVWQSRFNHVLDITTSQPSIPFGKVRNHIQSVIETLAVHDSVQRFEGLGVTVIQETGAFLDKTTLKAGKYDIKAKRFVIATGTHASAPPIPGLNETHHYTNETIFSLTELPTHLMIIGGGPIGCELAQAFAMLGSKVSLIEGFNILSKDDPEAVDVVRQSLINTGIELLEQVKIIQIHSDEQGAIKIDLEQEGKAFALEGTHLLIAAGRTPNISQLNCQKAGIEVNNKGILVDQRLRTSNKNIFAIGDVIGKLQFTHTANDHAGVVLRNIAFKIPAKLNEDAVPWVTYTHPELAHVGKNESQCKTMGMKHQVLKVDFTNNDRAQTSRDTVGFIKVIVKPNGTILGVTIVGAQAGELLLPWTMAIREGKTLRAFTDTIIAYPTLSEISKRVASLFYTPTLFSNKVRKLVRFLSYF